MFCRYCGKKLGPNDKFCTSCGNPVQSNYNVKNTNPIKSNTEKVKMTVDQFTEAVNELVGGEGAVQLKVKDLFSDVFKKHSNEEAEQIFICGTSKTTPHVESILTNWPKPWLYTRVALYMLLAFYILVFSYYSFESYNVIPGIITIGSSVMPLSVLLFLFEVNVPRNISIFDIIKIFCIGGCSSILITLMLYELIHVYEITFFSAFLIGIIEEVGKLVVVIFYIIRNKKCSYLLNGLLVGATVGAGFAVFESTGYAFRYLISADFESMMNVIYLRGFLSPGGHIAWTAVAGFAIVLIKGQNSFSLDMLKDRRFLILFASQIAMHAVWDMPINISETIPIVQIALILLAWIIILVLIHNGLEEINIRQQNNMF